MSQLITDPTLNSSEEIQGCSVPLKLSFRAETEHLSLLVLLSLSVFLLCHCRLADKLCPPRGNAVPGGVPVLCASMRNWQSHKIVPVPLGFCSSPKMFPLLLICCKVPPQPLRLPASISAGFVLSKNIMLQFSLQGNGAGDACLPLGEEDMYKMYSCL